MLANLYDYVSEVYGLDLDECVQYPSMLKEDEEVFIEALEFMFERNYKFRFDW